MNYQGVYDSKKACYEISYEIAFRQTTCVFFEQEQIYLTADIEGNAVFYDIDENEICRAKAEYGDEHFFEIYCKVMNNTITVRFPIKEEVDHYPNCDGEYDRYTYRTIDNVIIEYKL